MALADLIQGLNYQLTRRDTIGRPVMTEIGMADPARLSGFLGDLPQYNPDELVRKKGGLRIYDKMREDDQVRAVLNVKKFARLATGWDISPAGEEPGDQDAADFTDFVFERMEGTVSESLLQMMNGLDYGYSIIEINWDIIQGGPWDGLVGIKSLKARKPHDINFKQDVHGNITGIVQQNTREGDIPLPLDKFAHWSYDAEFDNPYGRSDMRAAYKNYFSKDIIIRFWNIILERHAEPFSHWAYGQGASAADIDAVKTIVKNMTVRKGAVTSDAFKLDMHESEMRGAATIKDAIQYHDLAIARAMLMPKQLGLTEGGETGTFSQSQIHFRIFIALLDALGGQIADVINEQIIRRLMGFNFELEAIPTFGWREMTDEIRSDIATVWIAAVEKGVVAPSLEDENTFRELVKFPPREATQQVVGETQMMLNGHQHDHQQRRAKSRYEKRVDFAAIESGLNTRQDDAVAALVKTLDEARQNVVKRLRRSAGNGGLGINDIKNVQLPFKSRLRSEYVNNVKDVFAFGGQTAFRDIKGTRTAQSLDVRTFLTAKEAAAFFAAKGDFFITGVEDAILAKIKPILLDGIKSGATLPELTRRVNRVFAEFIGDPVEGLSPARIENVVRTNFTEAFNEGRKAAFNDPDVVADIAGVEYSAILDERTTDVCSQLDGRIFRNDDPDLARFTPPLHYQCRSVLVPVLIDDIPRGGLDFITEGQKGSARESAQVGFGGESQRPPLAGVTSEEGRQRQGG